MSSYLDVDNAFVLFFYGSYRKIHDLASSGIVLYDPQGKLVVKKGLKVDAHTNIEAEYAVLEVGLPYCLKLGVKRVQIKGDALLVVKQVLGVCQNKNPILKQFCFRIRSLLK